MSSLNKFKDKKTGISYDFEDTVARQSIEELRSQIDGGLAVTGASVGQTVKIAAVDDNGVPTAWEPVNLPGNEQYELIETITIEEDGVKKITRNSYPDGTRYSLKKIFATIKFPLLEADYTTGNMEMTLSSNSERVYSGYGGTITLSPNQYGRYFQMTVIGEINSGVLIGHNNIGTIVQLEHAQRNVGPIAIYMGNKTITQLFMGVANGIPIGSTVEIYGVKA